MSADLTGRRIVIGRLDGPAVSVRPIVGVSGVRRACVFPRGTTARVLIVSAHVDLPAELTTTLFAAGSQSRTCTSVEEAGRFLAQAPTWPNVIAVAATLPDGSARDVIAIANRERVQARVVMEQEERVDLWLARLADSGVTVSTGQPTQDAELSALAVGLNERDRAACAAAVPTDAVLYVRRGLRSGVRNVSSLGVVRGRALVSEAVYALMSEAYRIHVVTSRIGATVLASFAGRHALLRRVSALQRTVALELAWYER